MAVSGGARPDAGRRGYAPPPAAGAQAEDRTTVFRATLQEPNQRTAEVSTDDLRAILADGGATVFDARPHLEWAIGHIPGALNVAPKPDVPLSLYVSDVAEIARVVPDRRRALVLYCNGPFCGKSKRLAEELLDAGYADVRRYQLGAPAWRALVGVMEIEPDGLRYVRDGDRRRPGSTPGRRRSSPPAACPARATCRRRRWAGPRTTAGCQWRTTTRASSSSGGTGRRPARPRRRSPGTPSTTSPTSATPSTPSGPRSRRPRPTRHPSTRGRWYALGSLSLCCVRAAAERRA